VDFLTYDLETSYGKSNGRVGNRWDAEFGLCSVGYKYGKGSYGDIYTVDDNGGIRRGRRPIDGLPFPSLDGISLLVGHNIKFDLLWYWDHPDFIAFLKRGGKVWDTMYAEYLLSGQFFTMSGHGNMAINLKTCAIRRGLTSQKLDIVKALWDDGVRTEDIDENILLEYQKYDVLTTEELFLAQIKQAREQGMVTQIQQRMEGLLATTEMEFNGMYIDQAIAKVQQEELQEQIKILESNLLQYIPELPSGCEFKWTSWRNVSALIFGGEIKYTGIENSLKDGQVQYYQKDAIEQVLGEDGKQAFFKTGKNAGLAKTRKIKVLDYERGAKTRQCAMFTSLPGMTKPHHKWKSSEEGYWSTAEAVMDKLKERGLDLVDDLLKLKGAQKDLGTYYSRFHKGKWTGMLTNIQPDGMVHGHLNHAVTVTTRLSSSAPNLQNIPKKGKSKVKACFASRFKNGKVAELDYGQLEVVCKGVLSGDKALLQALVDGVCFHCEWAAFAHQENYDLVYKWAKIEKLPEWVKKRQDIKPITFGESYGAGITKLSEDSGLPADVVQAAIDARKAKYHMMYAFDDLVMDEVERTRQVTHLRTDSGWQKSVGYYRSPTDTLFSFLQNEAMPWQQKQGIHTSFSPTCIKNYPSQGLGGEIMQKMSGLLFRRLREHDLYKDILLINTVHDSVYLDFRTEELAIEYLPKIAGLLEDVCNVFNMLHAGVVWDTPFPVDADYGDNIMATNVTIKERSREWC